MNHHMPCPVCQSQIPIDLRLLAQGAVFQCPNMACRATLGLDSGSRGTFSSALGSYERMQASSPSAKLPPQQ